MGQGFNKIPSGDHELWPDNYLNRLSFKFTARTYFTIVNNVCKITINSQKFKSGREAWHQNLQLQGEAEDTAGSEESALFVVVHLVSLIFLFFS